MGKRKSKSSKQKQTKKKGNSSSLLGKTGSKRKLGSNGIGNNKSSTANKNGDIRISCALPKPRKTSKQQLSEKEDFEQQMNSLYERSQAASSTKRKSGRRRKNPLEAAAALVMKPASFSLTKSTNQLVEETMHQMGQILGTNTTTGNASVVGSNVGTSSLARAAAAIPSSERTPVISNVQHRTYRSTSTTGIRGIAEVGNSTSASNCNSFSALHHDSSDDEDDDSKRIPKARTTPALNFAPAAFSLGAAPSSNSRFLPTKTPPTTPSSNHHYLQTTHSKRATSLFGTINEEELEELHYQQQLEGGNSAAAAAAVASKLHHGLTNLVGGEVDDDL